MITFAKSQLTPSERLLLLQIARRAIGEQIGQKMDSVDEESFGIEDGSAITAKMGVFVSLHTRSGELRGCVGSIKPRTPLFREIAVVATQAASADRRFRKILNGELGNIEIEVSVLSPFQPVVGFNEIQIGVHGLFLTKGTARGLLLPQVASKNAWGVPEFLQQISKKAGLPENGWTDATLQCFTAQVFSDRDF